MSVQVASFNDAGTGVLSTYCCLENGSGTGLTELRPFPLPWSCDQRVVWPTKGWWIESLSYSNTAT